MFGRKKKKKNDALFGGHITPSCAYCAHGVSTPGAARCLLGQVPENDCCKRYTYDPLRREPKGEPQLGKFSAEDFKL